MSFPLPNPDDPSDPGLPAPLFADIDAVRGDQLRAAMQLIWGNFDYIETNFDDKAKIAAIAALLTGFVSGSDAAISATDTVLQAFAKSQGQITADKAAILALQTINGNYAKITDTKSAGTGGGTFTSGAWRTRTLNTENSDSNNIVTLSGNQFTLAAGTYRVDASAPAFRSSEHKLKLYNVTDAVDTLIGTSEAADQTGFNVQTRSYVKDEFTIAGTTVFELRHYCQATAPSDGFGVATNCGVSEVYAMVEIWKIG